MNTIVFFTLLVLVFYVLKILKYKHNWNNYPVFNAIGNDTQVGISIVIAFRNEVSNLGRLLSMLSQQAYPAHLYEIILVNDHSDDGSEELVRHFCEETPNFVFINCEEAETGKKSALKAGINKASHDLIITTDADCTMGKYWLASFAAFFEKMNPDMIIGLVDMISGNSFFEKFQEVEFLSLIGSGAGAAAGQRPIYCNAACFAFRKSLYQGFTDPMLQGIASGDDTLFMHAVKKNQGGQIMLLKSTRAIAFTQALSSWSGYINQRRRWVSKSRYYRDPDTLYTALLVILVNLCLLVSIGLFIWGRNTWLFPLLYTGKFLTDLFFLRSFLQFFGKQLPIWRFMAYSLIYPFYAIFSAITGLLLGYTWKGRHIKPTA